MKKYKYNGSGDGIPGLPHQITDDEISHLNPDQLAQFEAALAINLYVEAADPRPARKSKKSAKNAEGAQP